MRQKVPTRLWESDTGRRATVVPEHCELDGIAYRIGRIPFGYSCMALRWILNGEVLHDVCAVWAMDSVDVWGMHC
jgi:hypothetical protein